MRPTRAAARNTASGFDSASSSPPPPAGGDPRPAGSATRISQSRRRMGPDDGRPSTMPRCPATKTRRPPSGKSRSSHPGGSRSPHAPRSWPSGRPGPCRRRALRRWSGAPHPQHFARLGRVADQLDRPPSAGNSGGRSPPVPPRSGRRGPSRASPRLPRRCRRPLPGRPARRNSRTDVGFPGREHEVARPFVVDDPPHAVHIVAGVAPVALRLQVPQMEPVLQSVDDGGDRPGDLCGSRRFRRASALRG